MLHVIFVMLINILMNSEPVEEDEDYVFPIQT